MNNDGEKNLLSWCRLSIYCYLLLMIHSWIQARNKCISFRGAYYHSPVTIHMIHSCILATVMILCFRGNEVLEECFRVKCQQYFWQHKIILTSILVQKNKQNTLLVTIDWENINYTFFIIQNERCYFSVKGELLLFFDQFHCFFISSWCKFHHINARCKAI